MAQDGMLGWEDLFDLSDPSGQQKITNALEAIDKSYAGMAKNVIENVKAIQAAQQEMVKEAAKMQTIKTPDLAAEAKALKQAEELRAKHLNLNQAYKDQEAILSKLREEQSKVNKLKDNTAKGLKAEVDSLTRLKAELKEAEEGYRAMGKATDAAVKQDTLVKIRGLADAVSKGERALRDTKKGVDIAAGSYHELAREVQRLNADLKNMPDVFGKNKRAAQEMADVIYKKTQQLKDFDQSVNQNFRSVGKYTDALKGLKGTLADALSIGSFAAFFGTIIGGFNSAIKTQKDFEKSLSTLSAITGAVGEDLEFYKNEAKAIGETTTLSASQAVEAFKLMGSASPELLKNKEALAATTREAVILAEAAGIELPEATQALASTMAQFNLPATEASRIINSLAAGSKVGAAEVPQLTEAIDKAGLTAANFSVELEETVGAIEVLSAANLKGAEAGTALRNVLLNMSTIEALPKKAQEELQAFGVDVKKVADETIPLEERLSELAKISGDATAMVKVFGKENVNAAGALLQNIDLFKEYTEGVTGTTTALEQQALATDNLDGDLKSFYSVLESLVLQGSILNTVLRRIVQGFTSLMLGLKEVPKFLDENKVAIGLLALGVLSLNKALILSAAASIADAAAKTKQIIVTKAATIAQWNLNRAFLANPIGIVVAAVALLVAGFVTLYKNSEQVRGAIAGMGNVAVVLGETFTELGGVLKGVGQLLLGVLVPNPERIKKGIAAIQDGASKAFKGLGEKLAAAYNTGYNDLLASERKGQLKEEEKHQGSVAGFVTEIEEHKREEIEKTSKAAKEARKKAEEEYKKLLEIEKSRVGAVEKNNAKLLKAEQELTQARLRERIAAADLDAQSGPGREDAIIRRVELEKQLAKEVAQAKIQAGREQLKALDSQLAEELQKVEGNEKLELAVRMSFIDQRMSLEKALTKEEEVINEALQRELTKLVKQGVTERKALRKEEALAAVENATLMATIEITESFNQEGDYSGSAQKAMYEELSKLQENYLEERLQGLIETGATEEEVARARLALAKYVADREIAEAQKVEDARKRIKQEAVQTAINFVNYMFEAEQMKSQERIQQMEEERDRELENIALNEEGKERLRKMYDAKIRKEQIDQAKRDKKMRIFQATISMFQGIAGALSQVGTMGPLAFVLAALVAASGAMQIAAINREPLPQFYKGTQNAPEGFALVDERGPEVIERKGKKFLGYSDGPRVTYLQRGDKVHPFHSPITQEALKAAQEGGRAQREIEYFGSWNQKLEEARPKPINHQHLQDIIQLHVGQETERIVSAVRGIPAIGTEFDELGYARNYKMRNNKKIYLDKRYRRS